MRRMVSLLLVLLSMMAATTIESKLLYKDLVLTSIDVTKAPTEERPDRVEFPGGVVDGTDSDDTAVFLKNVAEARRENGKLILEGDLVNIKTVEKLTNNKPLFCIHGFNVAPETHMEECKEARGSTQKFTLIPVIWPAKAEGGITPGNYSRKREAESVGAGKAFKTLKKYIDSGKLKYKSLHAHSMGNRVLRYAADAGFTFDNIFMVAADTDARMFNKDYIEEGGRNEDGIRIAKMIKNKQGKIYVLYNPTDGALGASWLLKFFTTRLGTTGAKETEDKIHPELRNKVSSYNYRENHLSPRGWFSFLPNIKHNYHFDPPAMKFFNSKFL